MKIPPPPHEPVSLFRQEAVESRRPQQYGQILLLPGASSRWVALIALVIVIALVWLIGWGSYTRRTNVSGQVYPSQGLIRLTAAQPGVVVEQKAQDGQQVKRGDVLFVVSGDRQGPGALDYQSNMATQIAARQRSMEDELGRLASAAQQEAEQLRRRSDYAAAESTQVALQTEQQAQRLAGAQDTLRRYRDLAQQGFVSRDELLAKEADLTEQQSRLEGFRRDALALKRELAASQLEQDASKTRYATRRAELERAVMQTRQEFTEIEARRRAVVTAPADGQLTLVQAEVGQSVDLSRPLAYLVPTGTQLVARLYAPSRAAGFVKIGTTVLLRYDAFPYQLFGQQVGRVEAMSAAAAVPSELRGYSATPEQATEPMFAITVSLPAQQLSAGGQRLPLQTGMRVDANLLHEKRRLYEWILEPLFAARARLNHG